MDGQVLACEAVDGRVKARGVRVEMMAPASVRCM